MLGMALGGGGEDVRCRMYGCTWERVGGGVGVFIADREYRMGGHEIVEMYIWSPSSVCMVWEVEHGNKHFSNCNA